VQLACTVGIACYPRAARDAAELLRNAETAMAEAKRQGPGTVRMFVPDPRPAFCSALRLENALRHAIPRRELFLDYQPWIDARTGRVTGAEALVRWRHPDFGLLPPDAFIPLADETGLIVELGRWVLREACRQNRLWQSGGMAAFVIAANVSAAQFRRPDFADQVAAALAESGLDPTTLELEITETVVMQDAESNIGTLRRLKDMGVRIAIDDFGTGYSSLSYLKRLPIDIIKIDRSFLQGLATDGDNQAIVRLIVALAKSLKLTLIAEGVEEAEQLEFLRALDCDRAQGYLISRPVVPAAIAALCLRGERPSAGHRA
jgi:EAL domain-containing protein (putative c-di-GMP-specific phosphodiesterase class I)